MGFGDGGSYPGTPQQQWYYSQSFTCLQLWLSYRFRVERASVLIRFGSYLRHTADDNVSPRLVQLVHRLKAKAIPAHAAHRHYRR